MIKSENVREREKRHAIEPNQVKENESLRKELAHYQVSKPNYYRSTFGLSISATAPLACLNLAHGLMRRFLRVCSSSSVSSFSFLCLSSVRPHLAPFAFRLFHFPILLSDFHFTCTSPRIVCFQAFTCRLAPLYFHEHTMFTCLESICIAILSNCTNEYASRCACTARTARLISQ